jgi:hypothetical protein
MDFLKKHSKITIPVEGLQVTEQEDGALWVMNSIKHNDYKSEIETLKKECEKYGNITYHQGYDFKNNTKVGSDVWFVENEINVFKGDLLGFNYNLLAIITKN